MLSDHSPMLLILSEFPIPTSPFGLCSHFPRCQIFFLFRGEPVDGNSHGSQLLLGNHFVNFFRDRVDLLGQRFF